MCQKISNLLKYYYLQLLTLSKKYFTQLHFIIIRILFGFQLLNKITKEKIKIKVDTVDQQLL